MGSQLGLLFGKPKGALNVLVGLAVLYRFPDILGPRKPPISGV